MFNFKKWFCKGVERKIWKLVLEQKSIVHEMMTTPNTTYRYACLNLGYELCNFKIAIWSAIIGKDV